MSDLAVSLIVAALGSLLTYLAAFARGRIQARRLNRKFPVAGRFVTSYEDTVDGEAQTKWAMSELRQDGRRIEGETTEREEGRVWRLAGTLEPGGFIHGVYGARDPHDSGTGTFFLRIDPATNDLRGLWAGYDSVDGDLDGGRYIFKRCGAARVRPATSADFAAVCTLMGEALGELYVEPEALKSAIAEGGTATCVVAETDAGSLAGACTSSLVDRSSFAQFLPVGQEHLADEVRVLRHSPRVLLIRSIAVDKRHRGRGVAVDLMRASMDWGTKNGATAAVTFAWTSTEGCHLESALQATGFTRDFEIEDFWLADSQANDYQCPTCGHECHCSAAIFQRRLEPAAVGA